MESAVCRTAELNGNTNSEKNQEPRRMRLIQPQRTAEHEANSPKARPGDRCNSEPSVRGMGQNQPQYVSQREKLRPKRSTRNLQAFSFFVESQKTSEHEANSPKARLGRDSRDAEPRAPAGNARPRRVPNSIYSWSST